MNSGSLINLQNVKLINDILEYKLKKFDYYIILI